MNDGLHSDRRRDINLVCASIAPLQLGRNEDGLDFPQAWWRRHDEYDKR
jgi:hypothetical protein